MCKDWCGEMSATSVLNALIADTPTYGTLIGVRRGAGQSDDDILKRLLENTTAAKKIASIVEATKPKPLPLGTKVKAVIAAALPLAAKALQEYGKSMFMDTSPGGYSAHMNPELYQEMFTQLTDVRKAESKHSKMTDDIARQALRDLAGPASASLSESLLEALDSIPGVRLIPKAWRKTAVQTALQHLTGGRMRSRRRKQNHMGGTGFGGRGRPSPAQLKARRMFVARFGGGKRRRLR